MKKAKGPVAKGKSSLDRKQPSGTGYNGVENSIERKIMTGQFKMPGMSSEETKKAYREWQKRFRIDAQLMDKHYRQSVADNDPHADVS